ncbi:translation initiation factor IF-2 [Streptosporangium jomthongense]|uniref:Translation initiation factor eIF-2B n=1 Tax=Marinobacter aromaticivorans TaxID=1494078 RepID=A0ABW2IUP5_9GAMM|nr:initiation factor 2B [Marinobacter aromaticivorans]GGE64051.1 translation initiation factor IF-2 [Streptosporangium jomthongense]
MDPQAQKILQQVRDDHQSGAAQLAVQTLASLCQWLDAKEVGAGELNDVLTGLHAARPSMVPLGNAISRCRQGLEASTDTTPVSAHARPVIRQVLQQLQSAQTQTAKHATELVSPGAVLMTHSNSSQVFSLFRRLSEQRQSFSVICTQSSPGNEGFALARQLDDLGIGVTLITDAQLGLFMAQADMVVCGCDTWLSDGAFVNKSGTYLMALAARAQAKPCWVLADTFKDSSATSQTVVLEEMPRSELGAPAGQHITVRNVYFETIPTHLLSGRVSEAGVFSFPAGPLR